MNCKNCSAPTSKKCGGCKKIYLCSKKCAISIWRSHQKDCDVGQAQISAAVDRLMNYLRDTIENFFYHHRSDIYCRINTTANEFYRGESSMCTLHTNNSDTAEIKKDYFDPPADLLRADEGKIKIIVLLLDYSLATYIHSRGVKTISADPGPRWTINYSVWMEEQKKTN